jgi:hypothetical protein
MQPAAAAAIQTERLFVLYDTGETVSLLPQMADLVKQKKDFKFIAVGSSVNSLKKDTIGGDEPLFQEVMKHRITVEQLGIPDQIDPKEWPRAKKLSKEGKLKLREGVEPKVVIVGTASRVQKGVLKQFPQAQKVAFVDNFEYDTEDPVFSVVNKVCNAAQHVLCPSDYTRELLKSQATSLEGRVYTVTGKPSLEIWAPQIKDAEIRSHEIYAKLGLDPQGGPVIMLIGGYDTPPKKTYENVIHPLYAEAKILLKRRGYQVVIQPHPKLAHQAATTPEIIAISSCLIGYNSSVMFDAQVVAQKEAIYYLAAAPKKHFSIDRGYADCFDNSPILSGAEDFADFVCQALAARSSKPKLDVRQLEQIPEKSIQAIDGILDNLLNPK